MKTTKKAYGGTAESSETGTFIGGENASSMYKKGGNLKPIPSGNKGLPKLPKEVRNRMGYMENGGSLANMPESFPETDAMSYAKGGEIKFTKTNFNSHQSHNPEYDILEGYIDGDTFITYAKKVKGDNAGKESMEYYSGENYVVGSKKKSLSRNFEENNIPAKYKPYWNKLKEMYENKTYSNGGEIDGGSTSTWEYSIGGL